MNKLRKLLRREAVRTTLLVVASGILFAALFALGMFLGMRTSSPAVPANAPVQTEPIPTEPISTETAAPDTSFPDTLAPDTLPPDTAHAETDAPDTKPPETVPSETSVPDTEPADTDPAPSDEPIEIRYPVTDRRIVVCVDPGHGYDDPGTIGGYLGTTYEKEINLKVALLLRTELENAGFEVIMTRENDEIPADHDPKSGPYLFNPYAREAFVESQEVVDLFISIHCNSMPEGAGNEAFCGTELYYYLRNNRLTPAYAAALKDGILAVTGRESRVLGLHYNSAYYVTKSFPTPSVLVEMGYVTNRGDAALLLSDEFCLSMAQGIAQGITAYADEVMR